MNEIQNRIRNARKERELTQGDLADRLGIQPQTVGKWERGESEPDISYCCTLARILEISLDGLLLGKESAAVPPESECTIEDFRNALKKRRMRCGYSQTQLAKKLGIRSQTVSKWECGVCLPDLDTVSRLCETYGVTPTDLCYAQDIRAAEAEEAERKAEAEAQTSAGNGKRKKKFFTPMRIASAVLATFIIIFGITLGIYFGVRTDNPNTVEKPDSGDGGDNVIIMPNRYNVTLYMTDTDYKTLTVYDSDTVKIEDVDLKPPPNYRLIGWARANDVTRREQNGVATSASSFVLFDRELIFTHGSYYAVCAYEWLLDPAQYLGEDQYYKECTVLESFVIEYYEWLKDIREIIYDLYADGLLDSDIDEDGYMEKITGGDDPIIIKQADGTFGTRMTERWKLVQEEIVTLKYSDFFECILAYSRLITENLISYLTNGHKQIGNDFSHPAFFAEFLYSLIKAINAGNDHGYRINFGLKINELFEDDLPDSYEKR